MIFSKLIIKSIADNVNKIGWVEGINKVISDSPVNIRNLFLIETRFNHTLWLTFVDIENYDCAIVYDIGLYGCVIQLSHRVSRVYAIYDTEEEKIILQTRLAYFKITNVILVKSTCVSGTCFEANKLLLVGVDDRTNKNFSDVFNKLNDVNNSVESILLSLDHFELPWITRKYSNKYYLDGSLRRPFEFISRNQKIKQLGYAKYILFILKSKLKKQPKISINTKSENSLMSRLINNLSTDMDLRDKPELINGYFVKPNGLLLKLHLNHRVSLLRISFDNLSTERYRSSVNVLKMIENHSRLVPAVLYESTHKDGMMYLETCFDGCNINSGMLNKKAVLDKVNDQVLNALIEIQSLHISSIKMNSSATEKYFIKIVQNVAAKFSKKHCLYFDCIAKYIANIVPGLTVPLVVMHGDFSIDNIIADKLSIKGIIDWEFSQDKALPLVDLFFYFASIHKSVNETSIEEALSLVLFQSELSTSNNRFVLKYCEKIPVTNELHFVLKIMTVMCFLNNRIDIKNEVKPEVIYDKNYLPLLENLYKTLREQQ